MRTCLSILLFVLATQSHAQLNNASFFNSTDSTIVKGKIDGYSKRPEERFIKFFVYDLEGRNHKFSIPISSEGKFEFKFIQYYEGEFGVQFGANMAMLYAHPGEFVELDIDIDVADKIFQFPGAFKVKGRSASVSKHILQFFQLYLPVLDDRSGHMDMKLPYADFIAKIHEDLSSDLEMLNKYILKNRPPDDFINWTKNWLTYEAAGTIVIWPFMGKANSEISLQQLNAFLKNIPINNQGALFNASYYQFLVRWTGSQQMIINNNPQYRQSNGTATPSKNLLFDAIDSELNGLPRELAYYTAYVTNAHSEAAAVRMDQYWKYFDEAIQDNYIQYTLEIKRNTSLKSFASYNVIDRIRNLSVDSVVKKNLIGILENEKGRYVYIDFWGSWCKPCLGEMPYYKALIDELKTQPISFLFLSVKTDPKEIESVKKKYNIPAKFINLDQTDTDIVNEVFGFTSYPSHFIVDPDGNVISRPLISINRKEEAATYLKTLMR